jgi:hypothetical protein
MKSVGQMICEELIPMYIRQAKEKREEAIMSNNDKDFAHYDKFLKELYSLKKANNSRSVTA